MKRFNLIFILVLSILFIPDVFAYYDPTIGINNFYGVNFTIPNKASYVSFNTHGQASTYFSLAEQYDYSGTSDKSLDLKYFYHYKAGWINDEYGIGIGFYPSVDIPKNANVSLSMAICEDGDPWFVYNLSQVMVGENELDLTFVDTNFSRNTLGTYYQGISNSFNYCRIYKANFINPRDNAPYLGFRFKTTPGTVAGVGNMIAFIGYQLNVNGIDYTGDYFSLTNQLNGISNDLSNGLSSVERIAQDNSDTLTEIVEHLEESGDSNLLGTQQLKFTDNNGEISVLPVYYPTRNYVKFYNVTSNGYSDLGISEQYDFNEDGGSIPFSTKYFYTNVSGKPAYPNGLGLQWTSSYLIPSDFKVNVDAIIGVNTSNSNAITSISKVYAGANVGFYEADLVSDFDSMITRLDSCPDSFTLNDQTCYKVSVQFTTKNAIERVGLVFKSSSNISLGNWLTFYGYDITTLDVESKISATWRYSEDEPFEENSGASYALSQISGLFDEINDSSISTLILSPLSFISSFDDACSPLTFTIFGTDITLPCGDTIFWNRTEVQPFKIIWNLIFGGFSLWFVTTKFIKAFEGWADPFSDKVEVFDL